MATSSSTTVHAMPPTLLSIESKIQGHHHRGDPTIRGAHRQNITYWRPMGGVIAYPLDE